MMSQRIITMSDAGKPAAKAKPRPTRLRGIALPNEHGAWGMLFEPIVAAMAVAFSAAAAWIAIFAISAFLIRQPLKVILASVIAGRRMPQASAAQKFLALYLAALIAGAAGTLMTMTGPAMLMPLIIAAPLAAVSIFYDARGQSRRLVPELAGSIAITSSAPVIALAGGWATEAAIALWAIMLCRWVPSILYVRNRLLLEKNKRFSAAIPVAASAAAVLITAALAVYGLCPRLVVLMMVILIARAAVGLSPYSKRRKAQQIGIFEVLFGAATVLSVILGYHLGL